MCNGYYCGRNRVWTMFLLSNFLLRAKNRNYIMLKISICISEARKNNLNGQVDNKNVLFRLLMQLRFVVDLKQIYFLAYLTKKSGIMLRVLKKYNTFFTLSSTFLKISNSIQKSSSELRNKQSLITLKGLKLLRQWPHNMWYVMDHYI